MKKFNRYKVNASELSDLMGNEKGYSEVTDNEWNEFRKLLDKSPQYITPTQIQKLKEHVLSVVEDENPPLSAVTKTNIYRHYSYARFGASKVSKGGKTAIQLDKGEVAEPDAIKLLSKIDGVEYQKNEKKFENKFLKGIPDVLLYEGEKIVGLKEIKVPIDLISFFERLDGGELIRDRWEVLAYLDILGLKTGELCYMLVDMPEKVKKAKIEEAKLRYTGYGYTDQHIKRLLKNLELSMVYDYIPENGRVVRFEISRQGYFTTQMHKRVKQVRERMTAFHEKVENLLILGKTDPLPESTS
jgi:hypothetical protein